MNTPKEIAETIIKNEELFASVGAKVNNDALYLARAYLELEKELSFIKCAEIPVYKEEITKLKKSREVLMAALSKILSGFNILNDGITAREALKADDEIMKGK